MDDSPKVYRFDRHEFPLLIEALHPDTRAVVWTKTVEAPEDVAAIYIPPLARMLGHPITIRMTWASGDFREGAPEKPL